MNITCLQQTKQGLQLFLSFLTDQKTLLSSLLQKKLTDIENQITILKYKFYTSITDIPEF